MKEYWRAFFNFQILQFIACISITIIAVIIFLVIINTFPSLRQQNTRQIYMYILMATGFVTLFIIYWFDKEKVLKVLLGREELSEFKVEYSVYNDGKCKDFNLGKVMFAKKTIGRPYLKFIFKDGHFLILKLKHIINLTIESSNDIAVLNFSFDGKNQVKVFSNSRMISKLHQDINDVMLDYVH